MTPTSIEANFIGEQAASARLGVPVTTLRAWRCRRVGPVFAKFGRSVKYPLAGLDEYAAQATVVTTN